MSIFENMDDKNSKAMDSRYIAKALTDVAKHMVKKGVYTKFGAGFIKLTVEYNVRLAKSQLDNDRFLVDALELLLKFRVEDEIVSPQNPLPDLIKTIKLQMNDQEKDLESIEKSGEDIINCLNDISEEIDKLKKVGH